MILKFNVKEQTISLVNTKSVPRIGSKDYLVLQFSFSSDWENLDKLVYLQSGDVSQPINIVDNLVEVPEWFTEQDSFNVTLFGTDGTTEVPTNVVSVQLEKSNDLWVKDAPEPTPSWITELIDLSNHPPIPGSNGYWLLWDTDRNEYTESQLPLPEQVQSDWNQNDDTQPDYIKNKPLIVISFKPAGKSYLTFSSPSSFTLKVNDATKHWDGTLEYFAPDKTWTVWDGTTTLSAVDDDGEYVLYLRGTGNTKIGYYDYVDTEDYIPWVINGTDVRCNGNIETLLDYATVEAGQHPTMAYECFIGLFEGCIALSQAPDLSATTLADCCYDSMFCGCTSLTKAPDLPATTLADNCYYGMFWGCTSLTQAPELPATTLMTSCYKYMFRNCTSLTQAPALPATTLANSCCYGMFYDCTSLIQAPALPVTRLANWCYQRMFEGCTSLKLSTTRTGEYTQEYRIPSSGDGVAATDALADMFTSTGGTFKGTPTLNTAYYLSSDNMVVRETEIATLNGYVGSMIEAITTSKVSVADIIDNLTTNVTNKPLSAAQGVALKALIDAISVPDKLPNPNALTFTGAVTGSYDGSAPLSVEIPSGGGGLTVANTAAVGQTVKITAVDENGKPTEWEAADMPSGGAVDEVWESLLDVTLEEEVNIVEPGFFSKPQKKLRIVLDSLAADTKTNYSPVTIFTGDVNWNRTIPFYPPPTPMTTRVRSLYEAELIGGGNVLVSCYYCSGNVSGSEAGGISQLEGIVGGRMILKPVDNYGNEIYEKLTGVKLQTYGKYAAGTRLRVWGVAL